MDILNTDGLMFDVEPGTEPAALMDNSDAVAAEELIYHGSAGAGHIGRAAPPNTEDAVAEGREAWSRRKADLTGSWEDWRLIGQALVIGRQQALEKANKARPGGKTYNTAFSEWLRYYGFDQIDKADRAKLLNIIDDLDKVERWRAGLTEGQRARYNAPSTIWRAYTCPNRGNRGQPRSIHHTEQPLPVKEHREEDERQEELSWQRNILVRAQKAIGDAQLSANWLLDTPDPGVIEAVRQAAAAWKGLADQLQAIADAAANQLPEGAAPLVDELVVDAEPLPA